MLTGDARTTTGFAQNVRPSPLDSILASPRAKIGLRSELGAANGVMKRRHLRPDACSCERLIRGRSVRAMSVGSAYVSGMPGVARRDWLLSAGQAAARYAGAGPASAAAAASSRSLPQ